MSDKFRLVVLFGLIISLVLAVAPATTQANSGPPILLVDDDSDFPDARGYYTAALDNLGYLYDIWDTGDGSNEPTTADLAAYEMVIWFTGNKFDGTAGPSADGEAALANWLDAGGCFFISAQDYLWDRGLTPFMQSYLGVAAYSDDVFQTSVVGAGSLFTGLGPYALNFPFSNWSDYIEPDGTAETAFIGTSGSAALNKDSGLYRTTFWGFPFEALSLAAREETLQIIVDWCGAGGAVGTLSGVVTDLESGLPLAGATISAGPRVATTDADGGYSLNLAIGDYSATASAVNYQPETAVNVAIITDTVTIQNFALQGSTLSFSPAAMSESLTLGETITRTVTLTNSGPLPLEWQAVIANYAGPNGATRAVSLAVEPLAVKPLAKNDIPAQVDGRFGQSWPTDRAGLMAAPTAPLTADVSLILDDGTAETTVGLSDGGQFIWLNQFTPDPADFPFVLEEVHILFEQFGGASVGDPLDIYVYHNTTGNPDPGVGAVWVGSINDVAVQAADGATWSVYQATTPIILNAPGDVLIGAVNRLADPPHSYFPAAIDQSASAGRSWVGLYVEADPGNPPALPAPGFWDVIDHAGIPGNWLVRGYGRYGSGVGQWVSAAPNTGVIPANSAATFALVFDATSLYQIGELTAEIRFSGSFVNQPPVLPLSLELDCPTCGFLAGEISDGRANEPLAAVIQISNTAGFDAILTGDSYANIAVQPGDYTFTVSAPGYFPATAVVAVTEGETTITDFPLTPEFAELLYSPAAVTEFMTVGQIISNTITVTNSGTIPLTFQTRIRNYDGPGLQLQPVNLSIPRFEGELPAADAPISLGPAPAASGKLPDGEPFTLSDSGPAAYGLRTFPSFNLVRFSDATIPGEWELISPINQTHPTADFLDNDFSRLYAIDYTNNLLVTIDTTTGARTIIGPVVGNGFWAGMTAAVDGALYASTTNCGSNSTLYTISPETAAVTLVGPIAANTCIVDIAINAQGEMYGVDIQTNNLYQIDPNTGAGSVVGSLGVNAQFLQGLDFDQATGVLYWAAYTLFGEMRVIDTNTGASASLGAFPGGDQVAALAIASSGGMNNWATAVPSSATVPAGASVTFELLFDAANLLQVGDYTAELQFSGDFENEPPAMLLTLNLDCPDCGFLQGSVSDARSGQPVAASVQAVGDNGVNGTTSGSDYALSLPAGVYAVTASANGYLAETAVVAIAQGITTTADFTLTPIFGELTYAPELITVTVPWGGALTETFTISNSGTGPLTFSLTNVDLGDAAPNSSPATVCPPDAFGYTCTDSNAPDNLVSYDFEDISGTGTAVHLADEDVSDALPIGFAFNFYGESYEQIYISSNGFLTVLPNQSSGCCQGQPLPTPGALNGLIAGWWADLNPGFSGGGTIHYQTLGDAPDRYLVVQFSAVPHWPNNNPVTKQYKLFEGSNNIEVHYQAAPASANNSLHSAGLENQSGSDGLQYYLGAAGLETPLAVCYLYPGQTRCGNGLGATWLSQSPRAGLMDAGATETITLFFDGGAVAQTGVYTAAILFNGSFENEVAPLTVVMNVEEPTVAIDLTVTVSGSPECGAADAIAAPAGATVYYCYTVTNNGDIPLPSHLISDTVFGHIDAFVYPLMPGETESVIYEQTIMTDTLSTASWLAAHNGVGRWALAEAAASVTVEDMAYLRVAHLAPFAMGAGTAVTITLNSTAVLTNVVYGDSTPYLALPPGDYAIEIFPAGSATPAITATTTLITGTYYSAIAYGDGLNQALGLLLLVDDNSAPAAGKFHLRLAHLAPFSDGAATADIRLRDGAIVAANVNFGDATDYIELDAGPYDLIVTTPGGGAILIDPRPVTFAEGEIVTAFAAGDGANQPLGVFAWPVNTAGFFLPLVGEMSHSLYLPLVIRP